MAVKRIEERLWMFAYKMGSESAKRLAKALDIYQIKHEGSQFKGKVDQYILNWGAGTGVYGANTGFAKLLNNPRQIDIAINKINFFETMDVRGGPRIPEYTTKWAKADKWSDDGESVIVRGVVEGARGEGLKAMKPGVDIPKAPLYTVKVSGIVAEYRVYMMNDQVIDVRTKVWHGGKAPKVNPDILIETDGHELMFEITDDNKVPEDVKLQAIKASKKLGLFTVGLDVLWDGKKAWVLEANTAPWLGFQTAEKYAEAITKYVLEN